MFDSIFLTNLNLINRNLKFICFTFEVCIKIMKSSQAWTTGLEEICIRVCFQHYIWDMTTLIDFIMCQTGTGRCYEKGLLSFFNWKHSFFSESCLSGLRGILIFKPNFLFSWIFFDLLVLVNIHVIQIITWNLADAWHIMFSSDPTKI